MTPAGTPPPPTGTARSPAVKLGSAQFTLLNVFGELIHSTASGPVTTGSLVAVLEEVGFNWHAARQAISRCAQAGRVESRRNGRTALWTLTDHGVRLVDDGRARVDGLGRTPEHWDGRWLILLLTIPQERRSLRQKIYRSLHWAGFGSPTPGLWVTTHLHRREHVADLLERFELRSSALAFIGQSSQAGLDDHEIVAAAWDLDGLADRYSTLARRFTRRNPKPGTPTLRALLELDAELQLLPSLDPQLPADLVRGWRGRESAIRLLAKRQEWLGPAREHWFELRDAGHADPAP